MLIFVSVDPREHTRWLDFVWYRRRLRLHAGICRVVVPAVSIREMDRLIAFSLPRQTYPMERRNSSRVISP